MRSALRSLSFRTRRASALLLVGIALAACNTEKSTGGEKRAALASAVASAGGARAATAPDGSMPFALEAAREACRAKQWSSCAREWTEVASSTTGAQRRFARYNAACAYARDGERDRAFAALDAAIAAGWRNVDQLEADPDLADLHDDPRWAEAVGGAGRQLAAWERTLGNPQLRRELLARFEKDQAARKAWLAVLQGPHDAVWRRRRAAVAAVDQDNGRALAAAVRRYGWPGKSLVGEEASQDAWLLAQHVDAHPALQAELLAWMTPMLGLGEVRASDYALLYDRVAVATGRQQLYGTQFDAKTREPYPIEDAANVDARREAAGLPSMAEYRRELAKLYGPRK